MLKDILKSLRNNKNLSQREFAEKLGVSQQAVGSWEVGRTEPDIETLKQLARYFNVSIDYLLDNEEAKHQPLITENQNRLIEGYDKLNDEGQKMLLGILASLQQSHARAF
ncbi:MAG: helix-turn-helix transcriptional regulator [Selenomonadaceae bacterium]|nr:helix-turn-helix transcriptional regulator [Selenomonadaceae bacterium]